MIVLRVTDVQKSWGSRSVLRGCSLAVDARDRIGVIGANGAGKSTLLRMLAGEPVDAGEVARAPHVRVALLPQELPELDGTVWEAALEAAEEIQTLRQELAILAAALAQAPHRQDLLHRYGEVQEMLEQAGGYDLEARVQVVLCGLGLSKRMWDQPVRVLSGGERTRLNLARTLLRSPDLLLLDEPTNHLDVAALEWLEGFLSRFPGAVVIASHDRRFLDAAIHRIAEIEDGALHEYRGNYTAYRQTKEQQRMAATAAYERHRQEVERVREFVRRQLDRARQIQRGPKEGRDYYGRVAKKVAKRGQAARKRLDRLAAQAPLRPREPQRVHLHLENAQRGGPALAHLRNVTKAFGDRLLFSNVHATVGRGDRVGLIGPNGSGKTTLMCMLAGMDVPSHGEVWRGSGVRAGLLPQMPAWPADGRRVLDVALDAGLTPAEGRAMLAALLFRGDRIFDRVEALSGGERTRLAILELIARETNLLLLDEPTNHLDLPARERLEEVLEAYSGTMMIASHDRYLLDRLCTVIWSIEDGTVRVYPGNYRDFRTARNFSPPSPSNETETG